MSSCQLISKTARGTMMAAMLVTLKMEKVPFVLPRIVNQINMAFPSAQAGLSQVSRKQSRAVSNGMMAATHALLIQIDLLVLALKWPVKLWKDHIARTLYKNSQKTKSQE